MIMYARRLKGISLSRIRKMFEVEGEDIINLGIGEPDFEIPEDSKKAIIDALEEGFTHYTPNKGIPELREAIAKKLKSDNNIKRDPDDIIVTVGASEALYMCAQALIDKKDEVLIPDPGFLSYNACVKLAEGKPIPIPLEGKNFRTNPETIESLIGKNTKAIILNSPSNPTGAVTEKDDIKAIAELAEEKNLIIISDEVYEKIIYEKKHYSPGQFTENAIIINGFSKTYAMTGLRIGYITAPREVIEELLKIHQYNTACAPSISQAAALSALKGPQRVVDHMVAEFRRRRNLMHKRLNNMGIECNKPGGAFYMFPYVGDEAKFTEKALEEGVVVVPGSAFGYNGKDHVRFSYATSYDKIKEAMDRIENITDVIPIG
ncbi:MAG: pyridoxal phosphate-dependent aminotransferase [Methanothermobacter sp.]|nr:pyridoxal phosphate-dependent aminotransferase [Methanothermobacter tenebrarum]MDD3455070.1 pyridoxal phosphate-dependent aminotransferase [Methanobacteriales archaeon]MDI6881513.1 pyridoxal phosphate-dependent aminotransferase [Methanothermobacter sp.]MDX9693075.1 pyridoxal phosphate-dependent aminotransferase [Methanothermobacter sp.]